MLVPDVATGKGLFSLWQRLQLARDFHPLQRRAAGVLALPTQPGDQRQRPVDLVLPGLVEAAHAIGEDRLRPVDDAADFDQGLAERTVVLGAQPAWEIVQGCLDPCERSPRSIA